MLLYQLGLETASAVVRGVQPKLAVFGLEGLAGIAVAAIARVRLLVRGDTCAHVQAAWRLGLIQTLNSGHEKVYRRNNLISVL